MNKVEYNFPYPTSYQSTYKTILNRSDAMIFFLQTEVDVILRILSTKTTEVIKEFIGAVYKNRKNK